MRVLLLLVVMCAIAESTNLRQQFREWQVKWGKASEDLSDSAARFRTFKHNAERIELINKGQNEWVAGLTYFADLTDDEMKQYTGYNATQPEGEEVPEDMDIVQRAPSDDAIPDKKYWEMGPAQNQWACGSCWAFAAIGTIEGYHIKEEGVYKGFSEQTLLDCTFTDWNSGKGRDGCKGGWIDSGVSWAGKTKISKSSNHGYLPLRSENSYASSDPEGCADETAGFYNALQAAKPYMRYPRDGFGMNDAGLLKAVATQGPIAIAMYSSWALPFYTTGTYVGTGCGENPTPNHALVVAGYEEGWWYIRNSWGSSWGYSGYFYMTRKYENLCSVAGRRRQMTWNHNKQWSICNNLDPVMRTPCVDDQILDQGECEQKGCCYDGSKAGTTKQCFAHGKITLHDDAGNRRVFYGSEGDLTRHGDDTEYSWKAVGNTVDAEFGMWIVHSEPMWYGESQVISRGHSGSVGFVVQSVRLITIKDTMSLFAYPNFGGNKITISKDMPKMPNNLNNEVSSIFSNGNWKVCKESYYNGECKTSRVVNFNPERVAAIGEDVISSVEHL